jgi:hypothetical protein
MSENKQPNLVTKGKGKGKGTFKEMKGIAKIVHDLPQRNIE